MAEEAKKEGVTYRSASPHVSLKDYPGVYRLDPYQLDQVRQIVREELVKAGLLPDVVAGDEGEGREGP